MSHKSGSSKVRHQPVSRCCGMRAGHGTVGLLLTSAVSSDPFQIHTRTLSILPTSAYTAAILTTPHHLSGCVPSASSTGHRNTRPVLPVHLGSYNSLASPQPLVLGYLAIRKGRISPYFQPSPGYTAALTRWPAGPTNALPECPRRQACCSASPEGPPLTG